MEDVLQRDGLKKGPPQQQTTEQSPRNANIQPTNREASDNVPKLEGEEQTGDPSSEESPITSPEAHPEEQECTINHIVPHTRTPKGVRCCIRGYGYT